MKYLMCFAAFIKARGAVGGEKRDRPRSTVLITIQTPIKNLALTTDMEDRGIIRKDEATRREGGRHRMLLVRRIEGQG
jgi:hypothetical protein